MDGNKCPILWTADPFRMIRHLGKLVYMATRSTHIIHTLPPAAPSGGGDDRFCRGLRSIGRLLKEAQSKAYGAPPFHLRIERAKLFLAFPAFPLPFGTL